MKRFLCEFIFLVCVFCALLPAIFNPNIPSIWKDRNGSIPLEPEEQLRESVESIVYEGERSSQWQSVRSRFVHEHPHCEACGSTAQLNVHHVKPFKDYPELELDADNLITLCREHHFRIGHDPDGPWGPLRPSWMLSNPLVREDCKRWRK